MLVFFEMDLSPGIKISNGLSSGGHWGRTAFLLNRPIPSELCDLLPVIANHDTSQFSLVADNAIIFADEADPALVWMKYAPSGPDLGRDSNTSSLKRGAASQAVNTSKIAKEIEAATT